MKEQTRRACRTRQQSGGAVSSRTTSTSKGEKSTSKGYRGGTTISTSGLLSNFASYVEDSSPQSLSIEPGERLTVFLAPSGGYVLIQKFTLTRQMGNRELKWQRKSSELFATPHTLKTLKLNVVETH